MHQQKKYLLGFRVLCSVIFLRLLTLVIVYYAVHRYAGQYMDISKINIFSAYEIAVLTVLFLEAITYWTIRYRILHKHWVKAHVWLIFFAMVIVPFFVWVILTFATSHLSLTKLGEVRFWVSTIRFYLGWGLIIIANIFFVATLVNVFKHKNQLDNDNTLDVLNEFSD